MTASSRRWTAEARSSSVATTWTWRCTRGRGPRRRGASAQLPGDGVVRTNFGKDVVLDLSRPRRRRSRTGLPAQPAVRRRRCVSWLFELADAEQAKQFNAQGHPTGRDLQHPGDRARQETSKSAVATVFEKVNTGGLALNVFELLTASFAGDKDHYDEHGTDFRLNDDWKKTLELNSRTTRCSRAREHRLPPGRHAARDAQAQPRRHRIETGRRSLPSGRTSSS